MATIRLYLDEDVFPLLATVLRERGHDAIGAHELGRTGLSDLDQFEYSIRENRAILTFNARHFISIANNAISANKHFPRVLVSGQLPFKELFRRVLRLLNRRQQVDILNSVIWLSDYH